MEHQSPTLWIVRLDLGRHPHAVQVIVTATSEADAQTAAARIAAAWSDEPPAVAGTRRLIAHPSTRFTLN